MATTTANQGFLKDSRASGSSTQKVLNDLTDDLDTVLGGRKFETFTVADAGKVTIHGGERTKTVVATIINKEDGEAATALLDADNEAVTIISQTASHFGTTEDNDTTTNVYYDSGNTRFELNNEAGAERNYVVITEGEA